MIPTEPRARRLCPCRVSFTGTQEDAAAPYVPSVVNPLITTLEFQSGVKLPDLAGYAANVDFWITEVRHSLTLIDGYRERFRRFADAQARHRIGEPLPTPNLSERNLEELRNRLLRATERWIAHLSRCGLLEIVDADGLRLQLGIPYGAP